ncbi:MAG TPA: polysaccharide biosynthesis/export family protein, partial [Myxococcaceae bacterium]|nr:polysaccharide biosynthesis/export family protein [Myxococcaceae bacterium]
MSRPSLLAVPATIMVGCAGMRMDEGAAIQRASKNPDVQARAKERGISAEEAAEQITLIPISAQVLGAQMQLRAQRRNSGPRDPLASEAATYQYQVAPFDVLSVTVWDHPELTIPAGEFRSPEATGHPVVADGTMFYPYAGVIEVA